MTTFKSYSLLPDIQQALEPNGFITPTEIQQKALSLLLENNKVDLHGQAQTGTGKTLAFGLPLLHHLNQNNKAVQALIVAPTRELVLQICQSLRLVAQHMNITITPIYGGASMVEQLRALKKGSHIVVGTPGRLNDHLRRKTLKLDQLTTLVLDEADIMLDMGFKQEVDEILSYTNQSRNIWLFSATVKPGIAQIMQTHMKKPVSIRVSKQQIANNTVKHYFCMVSSRERLQALCRFIDSTPNFYAFIFCQTKVSTADVAHYLIQRGYKANALHGDMNQSQRNKVIEQFKNREYTILVATDVAARGIDIADLTHVINYSLPDDHESYVHRSGRTGRAGKQGIAISFVGQSDRYKLGLLKRKFNIDLQPLSLPTTESIINVRLTQASEWLSTISSTQSTEKSYSKNLNSLLESYSHQDLTSMLTTLLDEKFFKAITQEKNTTNQPQRNQHTSASDASDHKELVLNVGLDDGITKSDIMAHIVRHSNIPQEYIAKVKVIKRRSFIVVPVSHSEQVFHALKGKNINGRRARVDFTQEQSQGYCA